MSTSSQKTVLVLSQVYPPDPTSVGQHMHDAAAELVQRGYRVVVLASARGYEDSSKIYARRENRDGVDVRRLPLSSFGKASILIRLIGGALFTLQCMVRGMFTRGMTHMLVSTSPPMCPFAAVMIGLLRRVHITYWVMDLNPDQMVALGKLQPGSWPVRIFDWLNRRILKRARAVVAMDRFMAERLNRKVDISEKLVVSPPWPHEDHVQPVEHQHNPFRREHKLDGKTVIMYSGNLSIASPVTTILEAARRVEDLEDLLFLFIGGGLGKREVDERIAAENPPNIRSLPYQPIERLRYSLSAADVHLVSVGQDIVGICHPCKIYGSMAVSRPILLLGPNPCHVSDILDGQQIGWSLEYGDVDRAEQVIREIYACDSEQRMEMGRRARLVVDEKFTKQQLCGQFCDVVENGPNLR
ncbi:MAG: glycosyltransferase family 4 protein [Pirellulales bacterium]|nr:glycosyltransferase family 4 protein [Pirellulales bacterium]